MIARMKPITSIFLIILCVIGLNAWFYMVDDSMILGGSRADYAGGEVIQLVDLLLFAGLGAVYLLFAFVGWIIKHGRARDYDQEERKKHRDKGYWYIKDGEV